MPLSALALVLAAALLHALWNIVAKRAGGDHRFALIAAVLLLGERLSPLGMAGVALVVGGVFLIAGGPVLWAQAHDAAHRERVRTGIAYGALTGALIAGRLLGERDRGWRIAGTGLIAAGVVSLAA